jgi:sorting nexin-25
MTLRRRDVLLASSVAFVAWGFLTHWAPVLRYLWHAFIVGAVTTLALVAFAILTTSRRRQDTQSIASQLPSVNFLASSAWPTEVSQFVTTRGYHPIQLYPPSFLISQALDELLALALRDFITSWYKNITKSPAFSNEVDKNIRFALANIRDRLLKEDLVNIAVSRFVPIFTAHLRDFDQAERTVRGSRLNRSVTESEELDLAIAAKYKDGKLHTAAAVAYSDPKLVQQEHLRKILIRVLPEILPENVIGSRAVSVLIKEIVSCAVLFPVMQLLSDPDTWNQIIEAYGRTALQDRKTVRRMRAALDEHASPGPKKLQNQDFVRLAPGDSERAFERFVKAIRRTNNLSDARRFRSQVASQLKRESEVEGQDQTYLRRLETGKRVLDQKVAKLVTNGGAVRAAITQPEFRNGSNAPSKELSLVEIMHTSSGLSYFMEYMDRQKLMSLVQFWVVVDGFRSPLEDDFGDDSTASGTTWSDTDRMDIAQINEAYMSKPELKVPMESRQAIKAFLQAGTKATAQQYRAARTAILTAQSEVLDILLSKHLPGFRKSDLYYKFLASDDYRRATPPIPVGDEDERKTSPTILVRPQAAPMIRTISQPAKLKDLRRAAVSTSDMRSLSSASLLEDTESSRRSFDTQGSAPLFDDGYDTDPLAHSNFSIGHESANGDAGDREEVLESMEAAMNDIMTGTPQEESQDDSRDALFGSPISSRKSVKSMDSPKISLDFAHVETMSKIDEKARPSLAQLGLVNTSSRIGVFSDNDLFPDEKKFIEDEYVDPDVSDEKSAPEEEIVEAAPGDLGLTEAITALTNDIERLVSQESVVEALTRKAELTNNVAELRILGKSKSSLQREIRRKELQRQQYIVQESDNSLYGRATIKIASVMVGKDPDGKEFALYVLEVQRQAGDQMPAAGWAIARRYSEFHDLHQKLRRRYPSTRNLEFPRRRMVMKLQRAFLQNRRNALEAYMQQLLRMPDVCRSRELRSFLSQQAIGSDTDTPSTTDAQDIVTRIYNSVTDGMDDFLGNVAVLDQLSAAGQSLISAATSQLVAPTQLNAEGGVVSLEPGSIAEAEAELRAFEDRELEPFVKPICDIFLETFELNRGNNWLRGRAVVVVLHQLLGGTVERKIRDIVKTFTSEESILRYIDLAKETVWPGGVMRTPQPRTKAEREKSKREANAMLQTLIPDLAGSVVGRANAKEAARRISGCMNNERLNGHLAFTILDEIIGVLFGKHGKAG